MSIKNNSHGNITVPFNLLQNITASHEMTPSAHPDHSVAGMPHNPVYQGDIAKSDKDDPCSVYISRINFLLHEISRQSDLTDNFDEKINVFIQDISCKGYFPDPLKLILCHDLGRYLHCIIQLIAKQNTPSIQHYLEKMFSYIDQGPGIALIIIPTFYEKINSMVSGNVYEKMWIEKTRLIKKTIYEYVISMHGLTNIEGYIDAFKYQLRDTPWGIDYADGEEIIDLRKAPETENTLCGLLQQLNSNITLGKTIISIGEEIYQNVLAILKNNDYNNTNENFLCREKMSMLNVYLLQNYPYISLPDCLKIDSVANEYVLEHPDMIYSAIAVALEKNDISQCYFQIGLARETPNVKIRFVEGLYWVENKITGIQFPLTLHILKSEKISGILDDEMVKFAIINSEHSQISTNLLAEWFDDIRSVCYEIEHPAIFITAEHYFCNDILPINTTYKNGTTLLMAAIILKNKTIINYLLTRSDIDVNIRNNDGMTALILAIKLNSMEAARALIKHKNIDVNIRDNNGITALMLTVKLNLRSAFNNLIKNKNINVNIQDCDGNTALFHAIMCERKVIIRQLLNYKRTDINILNKQGHSALFLSITKEFSIVKNIIKHKFININGNNMHCMPLIKAVTENRVDIVKLLLSSPGLHINRRNEAGKTAFHIAVVKGNEMIVDAFLQKRLIDNDITDNEGMTPLMLAKKSGNQNIIKKIAYHQEHQ
ncbi:ankyrin repeat domain-containing protein [Sodalis sp. dw_96]|uniref:ankyrin repeat domain-containing protein n=1 Tax=Sodalis sp. dw_96 TaxID=2719794 RepID=UPI001BD372F5|nr:ankyrin repeat domain-containing protein [Sodalis sp. dw_96]